MYCCMLYKGHALYKRHLYPCPTKADNICFIFLPFFNWCWSPVSSRSLRIRTAEVIPFSFHFAILPFNLAALKNWVLATTKRLHLAFRFISASCDPLGGLSVLVCTAWRWGDCARALFVWLSSPLLIALKSAWQFGSMAQAPQELPSDKMSPWLCSMRPIGWPDALRTWEPNGQSTDRAATSLVHFAARAVATFC